MAALHRKKTKQTSITEEGRAMAQAVSRRPLTAEALVRSRVSPCGICGGQTGTGTGFSPSTSVFPCQFHSTGAPLKWISRRNLIIFITGLHNKPSRLRCVCSICCGALQFKKTDEVRNLQLVRIFRTQSNDSSVQMLFFFVLAV
jgi:hypothetical protein